MSCVSQPFQIKKNPLEEPALFGNVASVQCYYVDSLIDENFNPDEVENKWLFRIEEYDKNRNCTLVKSVINEKVLSINTISYDHLNRPITSIHKDSVERNRTSYAYNEKGFIAEVKTALYSEKVEICMKLKYTYNYRKRKVVEMLFYFNDTSWVKQVYYNSDGYVISEIKEDIGDFRYYNEEEDVWIKLLKYRYLSYPAEDSMVEQFIRAGGKDTIDESSSQYKFDKNQNIVLEIFSDKKTKEVRVTRHEYVYDNKQNWIIKKVYEDNEEHPSTIFYRKIEYY